MLKKLLMIVILILVVALFVLIKPEFTGKLTKVESPEAIDSEKKETIEIGDKRIKLSSTSCTDGKLTMTIGNDGNVEIDKNELRVIINGEEKTANFIDEGINPSNVTSYSDLITTYSGKQNIRVEGPVNTIGWGITC